MYILHSEHCISKRLYFFVSYSHNFSHKLLRLSHSHFIHLLSPVTPHPTHGVLTHHLNVASCASNRWLPCDPSLLTTCSKSKRLWFRPGNFSRLSRWAVHPKRQTPTERFRLGNKPTLRRLGRKHAPQVCFTHMCDEYIPSIYTRNPAKKSEKCTWFIPNNYNSMAIELPVTFFGDGYIYYVILLKVGNVTLKDWESLTVRNGITWYEVGPVT